MSTGTFSHIPVDVPLIETKYRRIKTSIPVPESLPLLNRLYKTESNSMHGQMPIIWESAEGFQI